MMGECYNKSFQQPYIFLENEESYPRDELQDIAESFRGFHTFARYADNELEVFSDKFSLTWLRLIYGDLESRRKGLEKMHKIRVMINSLSDTGGNEGLQMLMQSGGSMSNDDYLETLEKLTSIESQSAEALVNLPEAIQSSVTVYEKISTLLASLPEILKALGGS